MGEFILLRLHRITAPPLPHRRKRGGAGVIKSPFCTVSVISVLIPYPLYDPRAAAETSFCSIHAPHLIDVQGKLNFKCLPRKETTMAKKTVKKAFQDAQNLRLKHPLDSGKLKLGETRSRLSRMQKKCIISENTLRTQTVFIKAKYLANAALPKTKRFGLSRSQRRSPNYLAIISCPR